MLFLCIVNLQGGWCSCQCCGEGWPVFDVDLTTGENFTASGSGMTWEKTLYNTSNSESYCDLKGVLKIEFPRACNHMQKIQLQFDLYFNSTRSGWNFDISDSTNNGYGGDAGHSSNSAEIHSLGENMLLYTNTPSYRDILTTLPADS